MCTININWFNHIASAPIQHHDYVRLEFKGIGASGWLSCSDDVCDLRSCPYYNHYIKSHNACNGELFQIVVENGGTVESGERLRFFIGTNKWLGCPARTHCDKRPCPGTLSRGANLNICGGEIFRIYARGRANGETVLNGDLVMISFPVFSSNVKYISIQGYNESSDTSMDYCPGKIPPSYDDYTTCSNNVFRIYKN